MFRLASPYRKVYQSRAGYLGLSRCDDLMKGRYATKRVSLFTVIAGLDARARPVEMDASDEIRGRVDVDNQQASGVDRAPAGVDTAISALGVYYDCI